MSSLDQRFIYHQIGRCTYQCQHTSHTTGKSQRHKQRANVRPRTRRNTHYNRQHQRHRTRITHEGSDNGRHQHDQQINRSTALPRQRHNATAHHLGQPRLQHGTTYDEQPRHHHYHRTCKSCQCLCRRQHVRKYQR